MIKVNPRLERLFLTGWILLWIALAVVITAWVYDIVEAEKQKAYGECYVVTITENVIAPAIPWYSQVVPIIVGQSVSCY
jgi:hypothetical protein